MPAKEPAKHQDFADLMGRAFELQQARRFHDAIAVYMQVLTMYPDNIQARMYYGVCLLETGHTAKAVEALRAVVAAKSDSVDGRSYLGNALQVAGDWEAAEAVYREALKISPGDGRTQNNLGVLLRGLGRQEEAARCFRRALSADPNYVQARNNLCLTLIDLGKIDEAITAGQRTIAIDPRYFEGYNSLGVALMQGGRIDEAITAFRGALAIRSRFADALANLAIALVNGAKPGEAVAVTDTGLKVNPGAAELLATRSVALNEAGDTTSLRALVDFDRLLQEIPIDPGPEFENLAELNDALARHILGHPRLEEAGSDHATRGGMRVGDLLADPKGPMARFERIVEEAIEAYVAALPAELKHLFLPRRPTRWKLNVWASVLRSQGYQVPHIHKSGWIGGYYCVRVSEAVSEPEDGHQGWIELGRPQSIYHATAEPDIRLVRPEEGLMVLFPSFFFRRTIQFDAAAEHICIAFDGQPAD